MKTKIDALPCVFAWKYVCFLEVCTRAFVCVCKCVKVRLFICPCVCLYVVVSVRVSVRVSLRLCVSVSLCFYVLFVYFCECQLCPNVQHKNVFIICFILFNKENMKRWQQCQCKAAKNQHLGGPSFHCLFLLLGYYYYYYYSY